MEVDVEKPVVPLAEGACDALRSLKKPKRRWDDEALSSAPLSPSQGGSLPPISFSEILIEGTPQQDIYMGKENQKMIWMLESPMLIKKIRGVMNSAGAPKGKETLTNPDGWHTLKPRSKNLNNPVVGRHVSNPQHVQGNMPLKTLK